MQVWNLCCWDKDGGLRATAVISRNHYCVEIKGYCVTPGSCVIHFYYNQVEQRRLLGFLLDGVARGEGVVLASTVDAYETLSEGLEMLGVHRLEHEIMTVEITPDLRASIQTIAAAAKEVLSRDHGYCGRLLCDIGSMVGQEAIFEFEGSLSAALSGLSLVSVTQYDGRGFGAPVTIEQFQTHALAIVGTAFFRENRHYTPPEAYFRKRAAGGHG